MTTTTTTTRNRLWAEVHRGTLAECRQFVAPWQRPTRTIGVPGWEIKRDGITTTETGEDRYLVLTDREIGR